MGRVADEAESSMGLVREIARREEEHASNKFCTYMLGLLCFVVTAVSVQDHLTLGQQLSTLDGTVQILRKDTEVLNGQLASIAKLDGAAATGVEAAATGVGAAATMPKQQLCSTRPLNTKLQMHWANAPSSDMSEGVWHANDTFFSKCERTAGCGTFQQHSLTTCLRKEAPGESVVSWTVGPFNTTGGFDWSLIKFMQDDPKVPLPGNTAVGTYTIALHQHAGMGADGGPIAGPRLSFPPLHNHHITSRGGSPEFRLFRQGDDGLCPGDPDGTACNDRDMMTYGYAQAPSTLNGSAPMFTEMLVNDVRPAGSPPMLWYANFTYTLLEPQAMAKRNLQPIALRMLGHTFKNGAFSATVETPNDVDSFAITETQWDINAKLITDPAISWHHSHVGKYYATFMMRGTAAELGLQDDPAYFSKSGCQTTPTSELGFTNHEEMMKALQAKCPSCFTFDALDSKLLCSVENTFATVDDWGAYPGPTDAHYGAKGAVGAPRGDGMNARYAYDRRSKMKCASDFIHVKKGESVTWISFFGPKPEKWSPVAPLPKAGDDPTTSPEHTTWFLYYMLEGEGSDDPANLKYLISNPAFQTKAGGSIGRPDTDVCMDLDTLFTMQPADYFHVTNPPEPAQMAAYAMKMAAKAGGA